jgi:hypothetical protein
VDEHWLLPTIDAEVGTLVLCPSKTRPLNGVMVEDATLSNNVLLRAAKPGIGRIEIGPSGRAIHARISRTNYVGLARFRHLEEIDDEPAHLAL